MLEENVTLTQEQLDEIRQNSYNATHPDSWIWDETAVSWVAPVPVPNDGLPYFWDENTLTWVQVPGYPYE